MNYNNVISRIQKFYSGGYFKNREWKNNIEGIETLYTTMREHFSDVFPVEGRPPFAFTGFISQTFKGAIAQTPNDSSAYDIKKLVTASKWVEGIMYHIVTKYFKEDETEFLTMSKAKANHFLNIEVPGSMEIGSFLRLLPNKDILIAVDEGPILYLARVPNVDGKKIHALYVFNSPKPNDYLFYQISPYFNDSSVNTFKELLEKYKESSRDITDADRTNVENGVSWLMIVINTMAYINSKNVKIKFTNCGVTGNKHLTSKSKAKKIGDFKILDMNNTQYIYEKKESQGGSKSPHWRRAHYHTYYKGPKNEKEAILHYIPDVWVGDPELKTSKPKFIRSIK